MHWSPLLPLYIGLRTTPLFLYSIESYWSLVGQTLSLLFRKRLWMVSMVSIGRLHLQWVLCLNFKPTGSAFNFCELIGCQTIKLGKSKREERILTCAVYCSLLWWSTRHQIPWWVLAWLLPYSYHMPHTCNYTMRSHTPTVCTSSRSPHLPTVWFMKPPPPAWLLPLLQCCISLFDDLSGAPEDWPWPWEKTWEKRWKEGLDLIFSSIGYF